MSTDWILPTVLAAAVLCVPGALLLRVAGVRTPVLIGAGPPVTVLLAVLTGMLLKVTGLPWTAATAALCLLIALLATALVRLARRPQEVPGGAHLAAGARRSPEPALPLEVTVGGRGRRLLAAGPAVVAVVTGLATAAGARRGMGTIDTLNGSYDAFFHLAAIGYVRADHDAFLLTALQGIYGEPTFYPAAWDVLAALLPFGPVTSANAMALAMLALLPAALAAMTGLLLSGPGLGTSGAERLLRPAAAALCAPRFLSLPVITLVMGLWPFVLGALCLPLALAALWLLRRRPARAVDAVLPLALLVGAVLAHPSNVFSLGVAVIAVLLARGLLDLRTSAHRRRGVTLLVGLGVLGVAYAIGSGVLLASMDLTTTGHWAWPALIGSVLVDRPRLTVLPVEPWAVIVPWLLAVLGALVALRRPHALPAPTRLLAAGGVLLLGLVLVLSALTNIDSPLARAWVNPWYGARERIAPLLMCAVVVLAMLGLLALLRRDRRDRRASGGSRRALKAPLALVLLGATTMAAVAVPGRLPFVGSLAYTAYGVQLAPYVTPRERAFIERSAQELPADAVVIGNPRDGEALYWSLGGVETVFPTLAEPQTLDSRRVARYVDQAPDDAAVCTSWKKVGADHLYVDTSADSGYEIAPVPSELWEGLQRIPRDRLVLVDRDGPYALYRIEALC